MRCCGVRPWRPPGQSWITANFEESLKRTHVGPRILVARCVWNGDASLLVERSGTACRARTRIRSVHGVAMDLRWRGGWVSSSCGRGQGEGPRGERDMLMSSSTATPPVARPFDLRPTTAKAPGRRIKPKSCQPSTPGMASVQTIHPKTNISSTIHSHLEGGSTHRSFAQRSTWHETEQART